MHAHHAPGAWPFYPPRTFGIFDVREARVSQLIQLVPAPYRSLSSQLSRRIKDLDWHQQRLRRVLESREPGKEYR